MVAATNCQINGYRYHSLTHQCHNLIFNWHETDLALIQEFADHFLIRISEILALSLSEGIFRYFAIQEI